MSFRLMAAAAVALAAGGVAGLAQQPAAAPDKSADASAETSGRDLLVEKCFQCHQDNTWRDGHKTRREWEATLYRMVGRGALWTTDEIGLMAGYLEEDYGPVGAKPAAKPAAAAPAATPPATPPANAAPPAPAPSRTPAR